ncbi:helix-turn-helix domain-containing protein [Falsihalocynthiibacter sp. SS001]|uniref:helix-turn-helix domain-containing protein n=1 Tax=Falsihalocynthiibacter sp. SS001 TaxID=3349698 RepID=UPI0036D27A14
MKVDSLTPTPIILEELGRRLRSIREQKGLSRDELAKQSGIGSATLERMESGSAGQLTSWIRVLMTLNMDAGVDGLLPENYSSPLQEVKGSRKRKPKTLPNNGKRRWGDEQ